MTPTGAIGSASAFPATAPTSEHTWQAWLRQQPEVDAPGPTVTVVAPHPDDETLGCGGLVADLCARGALVKVVAVTDGEASHPDHPTLAVVRRHEQDQALRCLGVRTEPVRLGLPDGAVRSHMGELVDRLVSLARGCEVLLAPWSRDGHTDHDACGAAAVQAARRTGSRLWAYPVWAWQWAIPADLSSSTWVRRTMSGSARKAKTEAMASYGSQTSDRFGAVIVDPASLTRFRRRSEVFADGG